MSRRPEPRWNVNIHYHSYVFDALPEGARTALDVGTGDGMLATELREEGLEVTGLDSDEDVLSRARERDPDVNWVLGDLLTTDLEAGSFDLVASIAMLHHVEDPVPALRKMAELIAPGGSLVIVGMARTRSPYDLMMDMRGTFEFHQLEKAHGLWEHTAPKAWPPELSYQRARAAIEETLPGATWERLPMFRYVATWSKPADDASEAGPDS